MEQYDFIIIVFISKPTIVADTNTGIPINYKTSEEAQTACILWDNAIIIDIKKLKDEKQILDITPSADNWE